VKHSQPSLPGSQIAMVADRKRRVNDDVVGGGEGRVCSGPRDHSGTASDEDRKYSSVYIVQSQRGGRRRADVSAGIHGHTVVSPGVTGLKAVND